MLNVVIDRRSQLAVLQIAGTLHSTDDAEALADSLLFTARDDELVLDLSRLTALDDRCAEKLHAQLDRRRSSRPTTIIASGEVKLALAENDFGGLATVVDIVELALDVVTTPAALGEILGERGRCTG